MMFLELLEKARLVALEAHKGQTDKAGRPYIEHCTFVSEHAQTPEGKIAGYLHDVLEDTDYPPEKLREAFGEEIFTALQALNHAEGEPYMNYIARVKQNPIATDVKLSDLSHNMDLSRLPNPGPKDYARLEKYKAALEALMK